MQKKLILALLAGAYMVATPSVEAGIFSFLKKKPKTSAQKSEEPKKTDYERILTDKKIQSAGGGLITIHKTDGKVYLELEKEKLGEEMLLGMTISSVSDPMFGYVGFKTRNPVPIRFVQRDSSIVMEVINYSTRIDNSERSQRKVMASIDKNLGAMAFRISGYSKGEKSILFDASSLFLKEQKEFFPLLSSNKKGLSVSEQSNLVVVRDLKSFEDNAIVKVDRSYLLSVDGKTPAQSVRNYPATIGVTFAFARLPKDIMTPRLNDTRVGFFSRTLSFVDSLGMQDGEVITRWRLVPKDKKAYFAGQLTEPVKPIVYYVDDKLPPLWREAIKEGVKRWNIAFEAAGFKNAIEARDYPKDDPEFDPDNFKYSCIRYQPVSEENAMGPSWVDPRSGEIITGTVLVYNDIMRTVAQWRFAQTAQLDTAMRHKRLSDDIIYRSQAYVQAHEIGHTLGLAHNMGASWAFSVDSLRSPSFTKEYGTTPSVMDYARFNYVAQPEDKGVSLEPPVMGVYDRYAIDWGYRYYDVPEGDYLADFAEASKMVEAKEGDPLYKYGVQQFSDRLDPTAIEEDLSNDPLRAGSLGLKNLKYLTDHLEGWISDDSDYKHRQMLYDGVISQALRYANNVSAYIPGVMLFQTSEASGLPRYKVVPKERQREALQWLFDNVETFAALGNSELEKKLPNGALHPFPIVANRVRIMALSHLSSLVVSHYLDSTSYSPAEYMEDVYQHVFKKLEAGDTNLTETEYEFVKDYMGRFMSAFISSFAPQPKMSGMPMQAQLRQMLSFDPDTLTEGLLSSSDLHETNELSRALAEIGLKKEGHLCSFHSSQAEHKARNPFYLGFGRGMGHAETMWMTGFVHTIELLTTYAVRVRDVLKHTAEIEKDEDRKAEWELHLRSLNKVLKDQ